MTVRVLSLLAALACFSVPNALTQELVPTKDPGVARAELVMNPGAGVDVLRLELQPGAARSVHQHDDVHYHLFLAISGSIEVTMGNKKLAASPGQAFYFEKGTPHGFRNTGSGPASGFEVFVRDPKTAAGAH
jgi:mannose-6-phosphate isomerase-like protein (cupin superfamily)